MLGDGTGKRPRLYIAELKGTFRKLHRYSGTLLILIYILAPWIKIGGQRLILLDLAQRKFFLFGATFSAMDLRFLLVLMLFGAFLWFLATALLGRIWCGYLCPQTVFLEEWYRRVEYWIEGNRGARRKLDKSPWTPEKLRKKVSKWVIHMAMSLFLSLTFVGYFTDIGALFTFGASAGAYGVVAFLTINAYLNFAWFREQFCNYICPYARFQGALTDQHTLTIGYDFKRGEPRRKKGRRKKGADVEPVGDCVNCGLCVSVCPQGIDIRDGYQLECITCGYCIDACTSVLEKHGVPTLISYTTEARLQGLPERKGRLRPILYSAITAILFVIMIVTLTGRSAIDATVTRAPGELYRILDDGSTQNTFRANLLNNDSVERSFTVELSGLEGADLVVPLDNITIPAGGEQLLPLIVLVPPELVSGRSLPVEFVIRSDDEEIRRPGMIKSGFEELQ